MDPADEEEPLEEEPLEEDLGEEDLSDDDDKKSDGEEEVECVMAADSGPAEERSVHITQDALTGYEVARLLTVRSHQLSAPNAGPTYARNTQGMTSARQQARQELIERRMPLLIHRTVGDGVEICDPNQMDLPADL